MGQSFHTCWENYISMSQRMKLLKIDERLICRNWNDKSFRGKFLGCRHQHTNNKKKIYRLDQTWKLLLSQAILSKKEKILHRIGETFANHLSCRSLIPRMHIKHLHCSPPTKIPTTQFEGEQRQFSKDIQVITKHLKQPVLWSNRLSHLLWTWHPMSENWCLSYLLLFWFGFLLMSLKSNRWWSNTWTPVTHVTNLEVIPGSCFSLAQSGYCSYMDSKSADERSFSTPNPRHWVACHMNK